MLNISEVQILKWEAGMKFPEVSLLMRLAECFEVSISELLLGYKMKSNDVIDIQKVDDLLKIIIALSSKKR